MLKWLNALYSCNYDKPKHGLFCLRAADTRLHSKESLIYCPRGGEQKQRLLIKQVIQQNGPNLVFDFVY
jgi:hypothetical protein